MIDIGVNFHSAQLRHHQPEILERARTAGVTAILATGTSLGASEFAMGVSAANPGFVFATAGVHPHDADHWNEEVLAALRHLWANDAVVAVGECGLDYNRKFSTLENQRRAFSIQLDAALTVKKPLFLHCRDAFHDFLPMVSSAVAGGAHGVVHCFTGTAREAAAFVEAGMDIGVTGWVTDLKRGQDLRDAVREIPLERLHIETDAPYLGPKTHKNRRPYNEPANLGWIAKEIAAIKGIDVTEVIERCTSNSRKLFRLPG